MDDRTPIPNEAPPQDVLRAAEQAPRQFAIGAYYRPIQIMREKGYSWRQLADWLAQFRVSVSHVHLRRLYTREDELRGSSLPASAAPSAARGAVPWTPGSAPKADHLRILVVENQTLVRELLVVACGQAVPSARVSSAASGAEALAACRSDPPGIVLLDLVLSDGNGLDLLAGFAQAAPSAKVIALSSHFDEFTLHRALNLRVHGLLDKNEQPVSMLREAIAAVLDGRQYISPAVGRLRASMRANPSTFNKILSEREQQILRLIGEGLANEQIAASLGISLATAKNHRLKIMAKLDIHSAPQLVRYAIEKGFAHLPEDRT